MVAAEEEKFGRTDDDVVGSERLSEWCEARSPLN